MYFPCHNHIFNNKPPETINDHQFNPLKANKKNIRSSTTISLSSETISKRVGLNSSTGSKVNSMEKINPLLNHHVQPILTYTVKHRQDTMLTHEFWATIFHILIYRTIHDNLIAPLLIRICSSLPGSIIIMTTFCLKNLLVLHNRVLHNRRLTLAPNQGRNGSL